MKKSYIILAVVAVYAIGAFSRLKGLLDSKVPLADGIKDQSVWGWFFTASKDAGQYISTADLTKKISDATVAAVSAAAAAAERAAASDPTR